MPRRSHGIKKIAAEKTVPLFAENDMLSAAKTVISDQYYSAVNYLKRNYLVVREIL